MPGSVWYEPSNGRLLDNHIEDICLKNTAQMKLGLKIDVDTYRGTKIGVPKLLETLAEFDIKASFFFSVGPDNMGRNLWRLVRPSFVVKMLRSRAPALYGWDILVRGTFWKGPVIGKRLPWVIKEAFKQGHEIGLHAWDHYRWQNHLDKLDTKDIFKSLQKGVELLEQVIGASVGCSAAPAWRCTDTVLIQKEKFSFAYNSDCRGHRIFYPVVGGRPIGQPQIPTTIPTYDEVIGRDGISDTNYNGYIMSFIRPGQLNVLTVHAEVEGISRNSMFRKFLRDFLTCGGKVSPLGSLLTSGMQLESFRIVRQLIPGREGWVSYQGI